MKLSFFIFYVLIAFNFCNAQEAEDRPSKWMVTAGAGWHQTLSDYAIGNLSDELIVPNTDGLSVQVFDIKYFIRSNWGITTSVFVHASNFNDIQPDDRFLASLDRRFGNDFFITEFFRSASSYPTTEDRYNFSGLVGLFYHFPIHDKWQVVPQLQAGITSIDLHHATASLKRKNRNEYWRYQLADDIDEAFVEPAVVSFGTAAHYQWHQRWNGFIKLQYFWSPLRVDYFETLTNILTDETITKTFQYDKDLHSFSIIVGMGYLF